MKNINIINKVISKNLDIPKTTVDLVNSFYWKASKEKLIKCEVTTIFWKHIGSVTISKYKVYRNIKHIISKIRKTKVSEKYGDVARIKVLNQAYERLRMLLVHRNNLAIDWYDKRIHDADFERNEDFSEDIESIDNKD